MLISENTIPQTNVQTDRDSIYTEAHTCMTYIYSSKTRFCTVHTANANDAKTPGSFQMNSIKCNTVS